jgi:predicted phage terminase large subunit-like protein
LEAKLRLLARLQTGETGSTDAIPFCPHEPTERQQAFLDRLELECLYGGAAGGGKSDALLMAALQWVHVPGYAALLLRRTYADLSLPGALMDRANEWLRGTAAKWRDKEKTWEFPSGASITFGYLETENDKYRYQGAEFQFIGLDEATQFSETQYRYLLSRIRRLKGSEAPLRARCASNPGGLGHEWVKARFVSPGSAERPFVPAKLEDNPHLDIDEYEKSLAELDHVTRAQLRRGDWDVLPEGRLFKREWFKFCEPAEVPSNLRMVRFWDLAATAQKPGTDPDWSAGALVGRCPEGRLYICDVKRIRETPLPVQRLVRSVAEEDGRRIPVWMEQEPGSSGVAVIDHYTRNVLPGWNFRGVRSTGKKEERAGPVSSQCEAGNVTVVRGKWNATFLDEICAFPTEGVHDDQVDAVSGAFSELTGKREGVWS